MKNVAEKNCVQESIACEYILEHVNRRYIVLLTAGWGQRIPAHVSCSHCDSCSVSVVFDFGSHWHSGPVVWQAAHVIIPKLSVVLSGSLGQETVENKDKETLKRVEDAKEILEDDFGIADCENTEDPGKAKENRNSGRLSRLLVAGHPKLCRHFVVIPAI